MKAIFSEKKSKWVTEGDVRQAYLTRLKKPRPPETFEDALIQTQKYLLLLFGVEIDIETIKAEVYHL